MADDAFAGRLLVGEQLAWTGKPGLTLVLTWPYAAALAIGLVWAVGLFSLLGDGLHAGQASIVAYPAVLMLLLTGGAIASARYRHVRRRRRTRYAVTNQRVLIDQDDVFTAVRLGQLLVVTLREQRGGRGMLCFGVAPSIWDTEIGIPSLPSSPRFEDIPDVRMVFELIQRTIGVRA